MKYFIDRRVVSFLKLLKFEIRQQLKIVLILVQEMLPLEMIQEFYLLKIPRISKINEPQLINILKGDMSFTYPRPLMKAGFDRHENKIKTKIYNVKPGLTGIGQ